MNEAIRLDSNSLQAYKLRAAIYGDSGRRDQAIADFRKALELDPSDQSVKKGLADLGAAQ